MAAGLVAPEVAEATTDRPVAKTATALRLLEPTAASVDRAARVLVARCQ